MTEINPDRFDDTSDSAESDSVWRTIAPRRFASSLISVAVLVVLVASVVLLLDDAGQIADALRRFPWWLLLPALLLTIWNYALRFGKWQLYLRLIDVSGLSPGTSLLVFLSAFAMSVTPGKIGELLKCALLRRLADVPVSRSSAIIVAERLTDGLAMIVLASIGAIQFVAGRWVLAAAMLVAVLAIALLNHGHLLPWLVARLPLGPFRQSLDHHLDGFAATSRSLIQPRPLLLGTAIGVAAWIGECAAFFLILVGLGLTPTDELFIIATFVLAVSTLAGALSMLPGGLGVAEASVAAMLLLLVHDGAMDQGVAITATLLIRLATLWFGVGLGVVALTVLRVRLGRGGDREHGN